MSLRLERDWAVDRWFGWLVAVFGCILILDQVLFDLGSLPDFAPAWNLAAALVAAGFVALGVGGLRFPPGALTALWAVLPMLYFAVLASWPLVYRGDQIDRALLWAWALEPAVATLMVMSMRPVLAVALSLVLAVTPALSALLLVGEVPPDVLVETPRQLGSLVYVGLFIGARYQLHRVARLEEDADRLEGEQLLLAAQADEEARISRLVHDEVLSVLSAAMIADQTNPALRAYASKAISVLEGASVGSAGDGARIPAPEAAACVVSRLRGMDATIPIESRIAEGDIDEEVVDAVCLAGAEALRNSLKHGGVGARRRVLVDVGQDRMSLTVSDDGVGFTPGCETERLGISNSIRGRMRDIGGEAVISSGPGSGTEVTASWTRMPSPAAR